MTEQQKKTLGLAIGSMICGCFSLIPIIGLLPSLPAIIMGIVALVKISNNKNTLKGNGLAIAGIIMGAMGIVFLPIVGLLAAIAIPNLLRAKISANDALAKSTLRTLSTAAETYRVANNGQYPVAIDDLTNANPPYITNNYCSQVVSGYHYTCEFRDDDYIFTATPISKGSSGSQVFVIQKGGILLSEGDFANSENQIYQSEEINLNQY